VKLIAHTDCTYVADEDNERLNVELEDQYRHGLQMKMSGCARRHTGLGFSEPEVPAASETPSEAGTDVAESTDGDGDAGIAVVSAEKSSEEFTQERKDSSDNDSAALDGKKPAMTGFVHSSSS